MECLVDIFLFCFHLFFIVFICQEHEPSEPRTIELYDIKFKLREECSQSSSNISEMSQQFFHDRISLAASYVWRNGDAISLNLELKMRRKKKLIVETL